MKKTIILILLSLFIFPTRFILAYSVVDNAVLYLKSKQDTSGKISGFGGESQWAAIAFAFYNADISTIKNPDTSLKDFLLQDIPSEDAPATEWEKRILAIKTIGENPSDFGGVNYVKKLENFANNHQIGEISLLNDDIFGLLALIVVDESSHNEIKKQALEFIISKQNPDGGFSWSTDPIFGTSDSNDTAAAIQALQQAKRHNISHDNLDATLTNAQNYLLTLQMPDGGFRYDTSEWSTDSDGASTAWALMALNVLNLQNSTEAVNARSWILNNQEPDGGFHWMAGYGSDTATTSHALIALSGNGWIIEATSSALINADTNMTPTNSPTNTPVPTATLTQIPTPTPTLIFTPTLIPTNTSTSEVLGVSTDYEEDPYEEEIKYENYIVNKPTITSLDTDKNNPFPLSRALRGFSLISFLSAITYWYLKLKT